ncbi:MAG TPA: ankyrin repeat domain-containing protein [Pyrinomonadaceae bacterium]|nr:ankyrin repeat domain-containing protein [Pyrinomonadaceae bacterium]
MKSERKQLIHHLLDSIIMRDMTRARALLEQGADVNAKDNEHGETPLIVAVKSSGVNMVRLLLEAGAKVDARDDWGRTALFYAPVSSEMFAVLLRVGANVHARDEEANTLLMRKVSESASLAEIEELLRLGVDPSLQNDDGETALDLAESLGLTQVAERLRSRML